MNSPTVNNNWYWEDRSGYDYENWDSNEPDTPDEYSTYSMQMNFLNGKWLVEESDNYHAFVCAVNKSE